MKVITSYIRKYWIKYLISILTLLYFSLIETGCSNIPDSKRVVHLVKDLEVITTEESLEIGDLFASPCKVVVYFRAHRFEFRVLAYKEYIRKYPHVSFLFYLGGGNKEEMIDLMIKNDFHYPILYDKDKTFLDVNNLHIPNHPELSFKGYVVTQNAIEVTNPGKEDFLHLLNSCN
ncbi:MAG: hypothetical protein ACFHWX_18175 [Bacteroidota bacterium]